MDENHSVGIMASRVITELDLVLVAAVPEGIGDLAQQSIVVVETAGAISVAIIVDGFQTALTIIMVGIAEWGIEGIALNPSRIVVHGGQLPLAIPVPDIEVGQGVDGGLHALFMKVVLYLDDGASRQAFAVEGTPASGEVFRALTRNHGQH